MKMNKTKLRIMLLVCLATILVAQSKKEKPEKSSFNELTLAEVRSYRTLHRVNEKPMDMVEETKFLCASPNFKYGPHYNPGVVYYINSLAQQGSKTFAEQKQFPVGAMIVKEKQERRTPESVQIITVMKKIKAGRGEDTWAYKLYDVKQWTELKVEEEKDAPSRKNCLDCHRQYKNNDYLSTEGLRLLQKN